MVFCTFLGMIRLGEAAVTSWNNFDPATHPPQSSLFQGSDVDVDVDEVLYANVNLPEAKMAEPRITWHREAIRS